MSKKLISSQINIKDNSLSDKIIKQNQEREFRTAQRHILKTTMNLEQQVAILKQRLGEGNNLLIAANLANDALKKDNALYKDTNQNLIT